MNKRLAIIATHPVQYYAPLFRMLSEQPGLSVRVFYTWGADSVVKFDPDFGKTIEWDIPLLDGYTYTFLDNIAANPGTGHFRGIINPGIVSEIENFDPSAVLVYGWAWQSHLAAIRILSKRYPVWFRGDSTLLDEKAGFRAVARSVLLRWIYRHIDKAFYVGQANRAYFERYGLKPRQLVWAPHAIDIHRFGAPRCAEVQQLREQLGIKEGAKMVLFAGKLEPKKRPDQLLDAFCAANLPDTHLVFAGNGVMEPELKARATAFPHHIHFLPFTNQSQMPVLYQACQLYCLPSQGPGETWGLAVNEAMAAGKAVLVSNKVGCADDLVKPGVNGAIFTAGDVADLQAQLKGLLNDRERLSRMGKASKALIQQWSFDKQVSIISAELQALS